MENRLKQALMRQVWPDDRSALLLKAALLDGGHATECWEQWKSHYQLDDVSWQEHKLLTRLAPRLTAIAPHCSFRPRIEGLAKAHWSRSQLMLRSNAVALDLVLEADIPVMLLKSAAIQAAKLNSRGPSMTSDLDVLVRREDYPQVVRLFYSAGWTAGWSFPISVERAITIERFKHGVNFRLPPFGNIDIHHQPTHGLRLSDSALNSLWKRAEMADFYGRQVLIPSEADMLVIASDHASHTRGGEEKNVAWVFDVKMLAQKLYERPDRVVTSAHELNAVPATLAALYFVKNLTGDPATKTLYNMLEPVRSGWRSWADFLVLSAKRPYRHWLNMIAKRIYRFQGVKFKKDIIPTVTPSRSLWQMPPGGKRGIFSDDLRLRHEFSLPNTEGASKLLIDLEFNPEFARRYQFDIAVDGTAIAVLSVKMSKVKPNIIYHFSIRLPSSVISCRKVTIESLPAGFLDNLSKKQLHQASAVPFRVRRLTWR